VAFGLACWHGDYFGVGPDRDRNPVAWRTLNVAGTTLAGTLLLNLLITWLLSQWL